MNINKVFPDKHKFLQIIQSIDKTPSTLYYFGKLPETRLPTVAIVGSRKPTAYGKEVTQKIAYELAARGVVIVSGLALGVDAIAHTAALDAGGTTIAGLEQLESHGLRNALIQAVRKATERSVQLGK